MENTSMRRTTAGVSFLTKCQAQLETDILPLRALPSYLQNEPPYQLLAADLKEFTRAEKITDITYIPLRDFTMFHPNTGKPL
jgi:hypothetical protein